MNADPRLTQIDARFDQVIDRRGTHCSKWDMMEDIYGVPGDDGLAMWVADMDFRPPQVVQDKLQWMLVCEFMRHGSLHDWLHKLDQRTMQPRQLSWRWKVRVMSEVAKAMVYLPCRNSRASAKACSTWLIWKCWTPTGPKALKARS